MSDGAVRRQNMTTLCENLACTFHEAGGGSQNHIMLGGFDAWLTSSVGGLDSVVNGTSAGWRHIKARVSPGVVPIVRQATVTQHTRFGKAELACTFDGSTLHSKLVVPIAALADFHAPRKLRSAKLIKLTETGVVAWAKTGAINTPDGVARVLVSADDDAVITTVGSGSYHFEAHYQ